MTKSTLLRLALRLLVREWRAGAFNVMLAALLIAITSHTTIGFFTERLSKSMEAQATHLLGGDLVLKSPRSVTSDWLEKANSLNMNSASTVEFSTVAIANDDLQLCSVKAVSKNYPLRGYLRTAAEPFGEDEIVQSGPGRGELWVEHRVLSALKISVGDTLEIGDAALTVSRVLTFEPDRGGAFYAFAPRILMNLEDLPTTNTVQPGSRVDYRYLFVASNEQSIGQFKQWLEAKLTPGQSLLGIHGERPTVSSALTRAESYMSLAGLVAILLAAVAIAMSARLFAESHYDTSALIRCLGGMQNDVLIVFLIQLSILALVGGIVGSLFGWVAQAGIAFLIRDMLPETFPAPSLRSVWSGLGLSFIVLLGFSLPTLIRLRRVSPLRVLRQNLEPLPLSGSLIYASAFFFVCALIYGYTQDPKLTIAAILGSIGLAVAGYIWVSLLFVILDKVSNALPLSLKAGIRNLIRREGETRWQTLAFGTTLMAMALVVLIRTDLLNAWQSQLPENAPNHFVMNVLPDEVEGFQAFLEQHQITSNPLFPVSRGRLTHINQQPVKQAVTKEKENEEALNRELNLTEAKDLQEDNRIKAGVWWDKAARTDIPRVSVESRLASKLGIQLDDELTFFIGSQSLSAKVTSLRSVKWDSFNPNFYIVFEPGSLNGLPLTHLTSFYLNPDRRALLNDLLRAFPAITLLEVEAILQQIKSILTQVTMAVEIVLLFVLAAGCAVTLAALQASLTQRLHEGALMRTLGASQRQIRINQWVEYAMMGALSGAIAFSGTEIVIWGTYTYIFNLEYHFNGLLLLLLAAVGALAIGIFGVFSSRKVLGESPMSVLREL